MRNIKMVLEYDGTNYNGWQRLKHESKSIQGILEEKLSELLSEKILICGAGRTDKGVHALGQVMNFHTNSKAACPVMIKMLNKQLPEDIQILKAEETDVTFHSRKSAIQKEYEYRIDTRDKPIVFQRKYTMAHPQPLALDKMRKGAGYLMGQHDFSAFAAKMNDGRTTIRTIDSILITKENPIIYISIIGDGFLYHMVRIIVGTLIEIGEGKREPEDMIQILQSRKRSFAGSTAMYQGLFLKQIYYK